MCSLPIGPREQNAGREAPATLSLRPLEMRGEFTEAEKGSRARGSPLVNEAAARIVGSPTVGRLDTDRKGRPWLGGIAD